MLPICPPKFGKMSFFLNSLQQHSKSNELAKEFRQRSNSCSVNLAKTPSRSGHPQDETGSNQIRRIRSKNKINALIKEIYSVDANYELKNAQFAQNE